MLEKALLSECIEIKKQYTEQCLRYCSQNKIIVYPELQPKNFEVPSYFNRCKIVEPKALRTRKDFDTFEGLATLVHSIAHIEFSAIDLALDAVYRFPQMPTNYKIDWLEVALDEIRHFSMLENLLLDLGFSYGSFPVHSGLHDAGRDTAENILDRIAIIPRYYEASGLDVSPQIIKKLENKRKLPMVKRLIDCLHIIYEEEIEHVQKGDKWFKYLCQEKSLDESIYFEILDKYKLLEKYRPHINVEARKKAGFSCIEIIKLGDIECS